MKMPKVLIFFLFFLPSVCLGVTDFVFPSIEEFLSIYGYPEQQTLSFTLFKKAEASMSHFTRIVQFTSSLEGNPKSIDSKEELLIAYLLIQDPAFYRGSFHFDQITNIYAHPDKVLYHIVYLLQVLKRKNPRLAKILEMHQYHFIQDYNLSIAKATLYWYQKSIFYFRHYASRYPALTEEDLNVLKTYLIGKCNKDKVLFYFEKLLHSDAEKNISVSLQRKTQFLHLIQDDFQELYGYAIKMDMLNYTFAKTENSETIYPEKLVKIQSENEEILRLFWDGTGEFKTLTETESEISTLN